MKNTAQYSAAAGAGVALLLNGCVTTEDPGSTEGPDSDDGSGSDYSLVEQLHYLPVPEEETPLFLTGSDLVRTGELAGDPYPGREGSLEDLRTWIMQNSMMIEEGELNLSARTPDAFSWTSYMQSLEETEAGLGVSLRDAERFIELDDALDPALVIDGPYSLERVEEALGEPEGDVYSFGDGRQTDIDAAQVSPPTGQGVSITETEGCLLLTRTPEMAQRTLDGKAETVADQGDALALAETLDAHPWYSVWMRSDPYAPFDPIGGLAEDGDADDITEGAEQHMEGSELEPFSWVGFTLDYDPDADEHVMRIGYTHSSAELAEQNAEAVEELLREGRFADGRPYSDHLEFTEAETDGEVLLATVTMEPEFPPRAWQMVYYGHEPLFSYH